MPPHLPQQQEQHEGQAGYFSGPLPELGDSEQIISAGARQASCNAAHPAQKTRLAVHAAGKTTGTENKNLPFHGAADGHERDS